LRRLLLILRTDPFTDPHRSPLV